MHEEINPKEKKEFSNARTAKKKQIKVGQSLALLNTSYTFPSPSSIDISRLFRCI